MFIIIFEKRKNLYYIVNYNIVVYIIKSKNANKHIVPDYAVLENEYKK